MACVTLETTLIEGVDYDLDLVSGLVRFKSTGQFGPDLATFLAGGGCGAIVSYCGDTPPAPTLVIPCPVVLKECLPCDDDPVLNISAEDADSDRFVFNVDVIRRPPMGVSFSALGCKSWCYSEESLFDAQLCAVEQAVECVNDTWREPTTGTPVTPSLASNQFQQCSVTCADGSTFGAAISAGRVFASNLIEANRIAFSLACQRARELRICILTTSPLPGGNVAEAYTKTFLARGGTPFVVTWNVFPFLPAGCNASLRDRFPYTWSVVSGDLPDGLTLAPCTGILSGTPTESGTFNFTIRATDAIGSFQQKPFTMTVTGFDFSYWTFDEASGNRVNSAGTGNSFAPTAVTAEPALHGNGIAISDAGQLLINTGAWDLVYEGLGFTFAIWFKPKTAIGGTSRGIANFVFGPNFPDNYFTLDIDQEHNGFVPPNCARAIMQLTLGGGAVVSSVSVRAIDVPMTSIGSWYLIVVWFDPATNTLNLQVNNQTVYTSSAIIPPINPSPFVVATIAGSAGTPGQYALDELGFWMRVLSASGRTSLYNSGAGLTWPGVSGVT